MKELIESLRSLARQAQIMMDGHAENTAAQAIAALEAAEARTAELRARVAELEGIVSDCQIMGFLQPKLDCSPTHRELVKRAVAAMAKAAS